MGQGAWIALCTSRKWLIKCMGLGAWGMEHWAEMLHALCSVLHAILKVIF